MDAYLLESGDPGAARLFVLAEVHAADTGRLLDALPLRAAARCLDVGCGIGAVTAQIARRFADAHVLGVDIDEHYLAVAAQRAASFGARVRFERASAHELSFAGEWDLVYSRFLLSHLRDPERALERIVRAARPGGWVAIEDVDFGGAFSHPRSPDFERYLDWYAQMTRGNGADPNLGRALFGMARALGLVDLRVATAQPTFAAGAGKALVPATLEAIGKTLVERGIASAADVESTLRALRAFVDEASTLLSMPRIVQVWGRVRA